MLMVPRVMVCERVYRRAGKGVTFTFTFTFRGGRTLFYLLRTAVRGDTHDRERGAAYDLYEIGPAVGAQEAVVMVGVPNPVFATRMADQ